MKKFCTLGLAAVALFCLSHQQASAWFNVKLKAGVDFQWQSANNCYLWGLLYDGQPQDPSVFFNGGGYYPPIIQPPMDHGYYGGYGDYSHGAPPSSNANSANPPSGNSGKAPSQPPANVNQAYFYQQGYYGSGFQPISYSYPNYNYAAPAYYPGYNYYRAPAYWYGY